MILRGRSRIGRAARGRARPVSTSTWHASAAPTRRCRGTWTTI